MHRRIITDAIRIASLTVLAKVIGAAKTVVIARYFGAGDELDAYLLAFLLPSFLADVLAGAIPAALLPILVEVRGRKGHEGFIDLTRHVAFTAAASLTLVGLCAGVASHQLLPLLASGFSSTKIDLTGRLLWIMLPILPAAALSLTWRTVLYSEERFTVAAAATTITPIAVIIAAVSLGPQIGVHALAAGTTTGALLESLLLGVVIRARGVPLLPCWRRSEEGKRVLTQYLPAAASSVVMGGSSIVDQGMAAMLAPGSVSVLNYGTRLSTVLLAVGPAALGTAIFPRLSQFSAAGRWTEFRGAIRTFAWLSAAVTLPLTLVLILASEQIARVMFERGAFTSADTRAVAFVQAMSLVQIPFSVLLMLLMRATSSIQANRALWRFCMLSLASNICLNLVLMRWLGVAGIALSTAGVHAIGIAYLGLSTFRRLRRGSPNTRTDEARIDGS